MVAEDDDPTDGWEESALGSLYLNEEGIGSGPVGGRVSVRADVSNFFLASPPLPRLPLMSYGGVNNESLRFLERSNSSFATLTGEPAPTTDAFIIAPLLLVTVTSPETTTGSDTVACPVLIEGMEALGRSDR
jgi:hypothetical protein